MPVVAPFIHAAMSQRRRREEARRACARCSCHPRSHRPLKPPIFTMLLLYVPSVFYLLNVHHGLSLHRTYRRREAWRRGITTEQFRKEELSEIGQYFLPYTRFFARRHLEKECQRLTLWLQTDTRRGGDCAMGE